MEKLNLKIVDVNGRMVKKILDGNALPPGNYQMEWDGKDDAGVMLPGGMYMYQVHNETDLISTGKVILIR
jgi:flagellar hook assembly protein FlgD